MIFKMFWFFVFVFSKNRIFNNICLLSVITFLTMEIGALRACARIRWSSAQPGGRNKH